MRFPLSVHNLFEILERNALWIFGIEGKTKIFCFFMEKKAKKVYNKLSPKNAAAVLRKSMAGEGAKVKTNFVGREKRKQV